MCMGLGNSTFPATGCLKTCAPNVGNAETKPAHLAGFPPLGRIVEDHTGGVTPLGMVTRVLSHERLQPPHSVWHRLSVIWLLSHGALRCQEQDDYCMATCNLEGADTA